MSDNKKTVKGFLKKGFVFCMIGVMALGMVACGGEDKKSTSTQPKTKTESNQPTHKKQNNIKKKSATTVKKQNNTKKKPGTTTDKKNDANTVQDNNAADNTQNQTNTESNQ